MQKNKKGFTLSEVLICLVVVGFIMALSVNAFKMIRASYTSLTYFAFRNVQGMVGELLAGQMPEARLLDSNGNPLPVSTTYCLNDFNNTRTLILRPDIQLQGENDFIPLCSNTGYVSEGGDTIPGATHRNVICESLVSMANTSGASNCSDLYSVGTSETGEPYISNLNPDNPNFITTNGHRYYLTGRVKNNAVSSLFGYRLLAVDLNSSSKPNVASNPANKMPPDIVTFLIMDNGEVYPLGVAADNINLADGRVVQYLNSKVKGYYFDEIERTDGVPQDCFAKTKNGSKQICNFSVVYVPNRTRNSDNESTFHSYREAFCSTLGGKSPTYVNYCAGLSGHDYCPPSDEDTAFDLCLVENVKPMFRYNFK